MIKISFAIKNKKYSLAIERGEDVLAALDKFLKNNRLNATCFNGAKIRVNCNEYEDSVSCRAVKTVVSALLIK